MDIKVSHVYITTSKTHSVLYTGVSSNIVQRIHQHKSKTFIGFTSKYNVDKLVYFEQFDTIDDAINREKIIKGYSRKKKSELIQAFNPTWEELYNDGVIKLPDNDKKKI